MKQPNLTMKYDYGNQDKEYVFCYKGRPFAALVSCFLPTPSSSYIDHLLCAELGLKLTDIQCKRISFAGKKLRLLGKISCTVQCVTSDGNISGNYQLKASVIEHLNQHFDTHCIAGAKMTDTLHGNKENNFPSTSSGAPSPDRASPSPSSPSTPASIPSDCSTPTRILLQKVSDGFKSPVESPSDVRRSEAARAAMAARSKSPPGFPESPQYCPSTQVTAAAVSPFSANIRRLGDVFADADTRPNDHAQLRALLDADPGGHVSYSREGITTFLSTNGYEYRLGHGRDRCQHQSCYYDGIQSAPYNCGFSGHWAFPLNFQFCGPMCRGGFCECLRLYR